MAALLLQITFGGVGAGSPIINSGPPPPGQVGIAYAWTASAAGGKLPYAWSVSSGTLPTGLSLNSATGIVSGTPSAAGSFSFSLLVTDANGNPSTPAPFMITVTSQVIVTNGVPPNGVVSTPYSFIFTAAGGTAPYIWSIATGSIAACGLSLSSAGSLTGTPGSATSCTFTVQATDVVGAFAISPSYTITITGSAPTCGPPTFPCSRKDSAVVVYPPSPFIGMTGQNQIAYDTSLNPSGTDPIVRATDSTVGGRSYTLTPSGSAQDNIWNSDDTMLAVIQSGSGCNIILGFNPAIMQITNPGAQSCLTNSKDIAWSRTNPNVLYTETALGSVYKTTFTSPTVFTQVLLFTPTGTPGCGPLVTGSVFDGLFTISEADATLNGDWTSSGQGTPGYVWSYNLATNKCAAIYTGATTNNLLHYNGTIGTITETPACAFPVQIHASGGFANGTWQRFSGPCGGVSTVHFWQIDSTTLFHCASYPGGHNAEAFNLGIQLNYPHWNTFDVTTSFCGSLTTLGTTFITNGTVGDLENHISASYTRTHSTSTGADQSFFVGGTGWVNGYTGLVPLITNPGVDEVFAITFSPYQWVRFFHNFTSGQLSCPKCDFRDYEGIVGVSQTGKFAAWSTDGLLSFGTDLLGNPRQDVVIGRLD